VTQTQRTFAHPSDPKAVVLLSGGLDSTVLAYMMSEKYNCHFLSFNYGQRHSKEILYAGQTARRLGSPHNVIDLTSLGLLLKGSALSDPNVAVPEGHYSADNMAITVVPNRNATMLSCATAVAVAEKASVVAFAPHFGDYQQYPDCRTRFVDRLQEALTIGNEGFMLGGFRIEAPFIAMSKADIVTIGENLKVPFASTWSCYKGGSVHCGRCGTCVERAEAFWEAQVADPTTYADNEYWSQVTGKWPIILGGSK